MLATILKILAGIVSYFSNRQLLEAGKAIERDNVDKAETKAETKVDKVIVDVDTMSDADVTSRLQKWRRKD